MAILMNRYNAQVSSLTRKAANIAALAVLAAVIGAVITAPAFGSVPSADRSGAHFSPHGPVSGVPSNITAGSSAASVTATAILAAHKTTFHLFPRRIADAGLATRAAGAGGVKQCAAGASLS